MIRTEIETVTGEYLDLANPNPASISLSNVAWGLSRQPRFSGQTLGSTPYTVAQHSIHVMRLSLDIITLGSELNEFAKQELSDPRVISFLNDKDQLNSSKSIILKVALLHDASEAFLNDLATPIKRVQGLGSEYRLVEGRLMKAIHTAFEIDENLITSNVEAVVRLADAIALTVDAYHLMPSRGKSAHWCHLIRPPQRELFSWVSPMSHNDAYIQFVTAFETIFNTPRI